jgi:low temperature requirement protein LtrA
MHTALYALVGRGHPDLLRAVLRLAPWTLGGATLILVAGFTDGRQVSLWLAALACTYIGAVATGTSGWRLHPSHFAERYGLIVIIALGEAFISIGIGASATDVGLLEVVAAILGLLIATSFWLAYSISSRSAASVRFSSAREPSAWRLPVTSTCTRTSR